MQQYTNCKNHLRNRNTIEHKIERLVSHGKEAARRPTRQEQSGHAQRNPILAKYRGSLAGSVRAIQTTAKCIHPISGMDKSQSIGNTLSALIKQDQVDETALMLDSTTVKVHQHASGQRRGVTKKPGKVEEA